MTQYLEFRKEGGRELYEKGCVSTVLNGLEYQVKSRSRPIVHKILRWLDGEDVCYWCSCEDYNKLDKDGNFQKRLRCIHINATMYSIGEQ